MGDLADLIDTHRYGIDVHHRHQRPHRLELVVAEPREGGFDDVAHLRSFAPNTAALADLDATATHLAARTVIGDGVHHRLEPAATRRVRKAVLERTTTVRLRRAFLATPSTLPMRRYSRRYISLLTRG